MAVDFGGGTFDTSIISFAPDGGEVLAIQGAAIGGELFDSLLFDAKVAPALNLDREYVIDGRRVPVPGGLHHMRTLHEIIAMVGDSRVRSNLDYFRQVEGRPLAVVEEIIYGGHAYNFFRSIEAGKIELSTSELATIRFRRPGIAIELPVSRSEFELLIERNLDRIDQQIELALQQAGVDADGVDLVVRTGGSSRIPCFVHRLEERFGPAKLAERDAYSRSLLVWESGPASFGGERVLRRKRRLLTPEEVEAQGVERVRTVGTFWQPAALSEQTPSEQVGRRGTNDRTASTAHGRPNATFNTTISLSRSGRQPPHLAKAADSHQR